MMYRVEKNTIKNKLTFVGLLCCFIGTMGCVNNKSYLEEDCENGICTSNQEYTAVCVENADGYDECNDSSNVNYTRTAADFRQYGERSPRDHRITQAGAGNNLSAAVPPSIDNEVVYYENNVAGGNSNGLVNSNATVSSVPSPIPSGTKEVYNEKGQQVPIPVVYNKLGKPVVAPTPPVYTASGVKVPPSTPIVYTPTGQATLAPANPAPYNYAGGYDQNAGQNNNAGSDDDADLVKDWLAEEGQSLKDLLTQWSDEAGWRLIWKTNRNYTLNASAMFRGTFADVASALVRAFARARPAPIATFYKGNRVLVIETMEDENAYD